MFLWPSPPHKVLPVLWESARTVHAVGLFLSSKKDVMKANFKASVRGSIRQAPNVIRWIVCLLNQKGAHAAEIIKEWNKEVPRSDRGEENLLFFAECSGICLSQKGGHDTWHQLLTSCIHVARQLRDEECRIVTCGCKRQVQHHPSPWLQFEMAVAGARFLGIHTHTWPPGAADWEQSSHCAAHHGAHAGVSPHHPHRSRERAWVGEGHDL